MNTNDSTAPAIAEGGFVLRTGKIFQTGEYKDKDFALSADEMEDAANNFEASRPMNFEHAASPLDGYIGSIQRVWHDGTNLFADTHINKHIDAIYQENNLEYKVSAEWSREDKKLLGLALVRNPRIQDAALMSAFSAIETDLVVPITPPTQAQRVPEGNITMSTWDKIKARLLGQGVPEAAITVAFSGETEEVAPVVPVVPAPAPAPALAASFSDSAEFKTVIALLESQKADNAKIMAEFVAEKAKGEEKTLLADLNQLVRQMKVTPAQADGYKNIILKTPAAFSAILPSLQAFPAIRAITDSGRDMRSTNPNEDAGKQLVALAALRAKEQNINIKAAFSQVCSENVDLATSYRDAQEVNN